MLFAGAVFIVSCGSDQGTGTFPTVVATPPASTVATTTVQESTELLGDPQWLPIRQNSKVGCVLGSPGHNVCSSNDGADPYHGYWAIDFLADQNAPVYAAGPGQAFVGSDDWDKDACSPSREEAEEQGGTGGNWVWIQHAGGVVTRYLHLGEILIENGEWVDQEDKIGLVGSTGWNVPCPTYHLHFERCSIGLEVGHKCGGLTTRSSEARKQVDPGDVVGGSLWVDSQHLATRSDPIDSGQYVPVLPILLPGLEGRNSGRRILMKG